MVKEEIVIEIKVLQQDINKQLANVRNNVRKLALQLHPFRMELLGVMFAGMALQRVMTSLLQPSLNLIDAFIGWTTGLQLLFLPAAMAVQDWGLWFLGFVTSMPDWLQGLINIIVILGVVLGAGLAIYASIGLALGSLAVATAGWTVALGGLWATLSVIGAFLASPWIIAIGLAVAGFLSLLGILKLIQPWIDNFFEKWKQLETLLPEPIRKASEMIRSIMEATFNWIMGWVDKILGYLGLMQEKTSPFSSTIPQLSEVINPELRNAGHSSGLGSVIFNPTVNVNASSSLDISSTKSQLTSDWRNEIDNLFRSRT